MEANATFVWCKFCGLMWRGESRDCAGIGPALANQELVGVACLCGHNTFVVAAPARKFKNRKRWQRRAHDNSKD